METQLVSRDFVAVVLETDVHYTNEALRKIILDILYSENISPWEDMELDIFENDEQTMLIARKRLCLNHAFYFDSFENLLLAAGQSPLDIDASLVSYGGGYYLIARQNSRGSCSALNEFSDTCYIDGDLIAHINEHGKLLIDHAAIEILQKKFGKSF